MAKRIRKLEKNLKGKIKFRRRSFELVSVLELTISNIQRAVVARKPTEQELYESSNKKAKFRSATVPTTFNGQIFRTRIRFLVILKMTPKFSYVLWVWEHWNSGKKSPQN